MMRTYVKLTLLLAALPLAAPTSPPGPMPPPPPRLASFLSQPVHLSSPAGGTVMFECRVNTTLHPNPTVEWWYLDHNLQISSAFTVFASDSRYTLTRPVGSWGVVGLEISPVQATDQGDYQCKIQGTTSSQTSHLNVTDAIPPSRPPPSTFVPVDYTDCCLANNISESCKPACNPAILHTIPNFNPMQACGRDMPILIRCGADRRNHIPCCRRAEVAPGCYHWCMGLVPAAFTPADFPCLSHADNIVKCFMEGQHLISSPPTRVTIIVESSSSLRVIWEPPKENADDDTKYRVSYRETGESAWSSTDDMDEREFVMAGLQPVTEYEARVMAINPHGASLPSYIVAATTLSTNPGEPDTDHDGSLMRCCESRGVRPECQQYLCGGREVPLSQEDRFACYTNVDKVFTCLSKEKNHTSCCVQKGLPADCLGLCSGASVIQPTLQNAGCIQYLPNINSCVQENKGTLPGPPQQLTVGRVGQTAASLSWQQPRDHPELVSHYRVLVTETAGGSSSLLTSRSLFVNLADLKPGTHYRAEAVAVGAEGSSLPSPAVVFLTYQAGGVRPQATSAPATTTPPPAYDYTECCRSAGVSSQCLRFCDYELDLFSDPDLLEKAIACQADLGKVFHCGAAERNHTSCCRRGGLPGHCLSYCAFDKAAADSYSFDLTHADCLGHVEVLLKCANEGLETLPSPPPWLSVIAYSPHTISLMWGPPKYNADKVKAYVVRYTRLDIGQVNMTRALEPHVILQNLAAGSEYEVEVLAAAESGGESQPSAALVQRLPLPPSDHVLNVTVPKDLTACCRSRNVSAACLGACARPGQINLQTCGAQLGKLITCAADKRNHKPCCSSRNVPDHCLGFCAGEPDLSSFQGLLCVAYAPVIMTCFVEGYDKLPSPPKNFNPTETTSESVTFSWEAPEKNSDDIKYLLYFKKMEGDDQFLVKEGVTSPYTQEGLLSFTHYVFYLVAVNPYGASLPSATYKIWTHMQERPQLNIVQTPAGYLQEGNKVTLKCAARGDPAPRVSWTHGGERRVNGSVYVIDKVSRKDIGRYTCVADNGSGPSSLDHYLKVQFAPNAVAVNPEVKVESGKGLTAELICQFTGYPQQINWLGSKGEAIPPAAETTNRFWKSRTVHEVSGVIESKINIGDVRAADLGVYKCMGSNNLGDNFATVKLVDPSGGVPPPVLPPAVLDVAACCEREGVQTECMPACSFDIDLGQLTKIDNPLTCAASLPKLVKCGADGRNHSACCAERSVPAGCLDYCSGVVGEVTTEHLACLNHITDIIDCMEQGNGVIPSAPQNVRGKVEEGYIQVSWEPPATHADKVSSYEIHYNATGEQKKVVSVSHNVRLANLPNIHSYASYTVYVVAKNHHGQSQPSHRLTIKTFDLLPSPPSQLRALDVASTKATLTWRAPDTNPGAVITYHVYYSVVGSEKHAQRESQKEEYLLEDLKPDTSYNVFVSSKTKLFESKHSNTITIHTAEGAGFDRQRGMKREAKIGIGIAVALIAVFVLAGTAAYCYYRQRVKKPNSRYEESVSFENPGYAKPGEGKVGGLPADPVYSEAQPVAAGAAGAVRAEKAVPPSEPAIMAEDPGYTGLKTPSAPPGAQDYATIAVTDAGNVNLSFDDTTATAT